jgi:hypothetical protein
MLFLLDKVAGSPSMPGSGTWHLGLSTCSGDSESSRWNMSLVLFSLLAICDKLEAAQPALLLLERIVGLSLGEAVLLGIFNNIVSLAEFVNIAARAEGDFSFCRNEVRSRREVDCSPNVVGSRTRLFFLDEDDRCPNMAGSRVRPFDFNEVVDWSPNMAGSRTMLEKVALRPGMPGSGTWHLGLPVCSGDSESSRWNMSLVLFCLFAIFDKFALSQLALLLEPVARLLFLSLGETVLLGIFNNMGSLAELVIFINARAPVHGDLVSLDGLMRLESLFSRLSSSDQRLS